MEGCCADHVWGGADHLTELITQLFEIQSAVHGYREETQGVLVDKMYEPFFIFHFSFFPLYIYLYIYTFPIHSLQSIPLSSFFPTDLSFPPGNT